MRSPVFINSWIKYLIISSILLLIPQCLGHLLSSLLRKCLQIPYLEELLKYLIRLHKLLRVKKCPWWYLKLYCPETSKLVHRVIQKSAYHLGAIFLPIPASSGPQIPQFTSPHQGKAWTSRGHLLTSHMGTHPAHLPLQVNNGERNVGLLSELLGDNMIQIQGQVDSPHLHYSWGPREDSPDSPRPSSPPASWLGNV